MLVTTKEIAALTNIDHDVIIDDALEILSDADLPNNISSLFVNDANGFSHLCFDESIFRLVINESDLYNPLLIHIIINQQQVQLLLQAIKEMED